MRKAIQTIINGITRENIINSINHTFGFNIEEIKNF